MKDKEIGMYSQAEAWKRESNYFYFGNSSTCKKTLQVQKERNRSFIQKAKKPAIRNFRIVQTLEQLPLFEQFPLSEQISRSLSGVEGKI